MATSTWRQRLAASIDPARVRDRVENVNDGILAISGFSEGLSGGGEIANLWSPIVLMAAFAGALSVACVVLSAELANRDAEQLVAAEEQRRSALAPEEQIAELAAHYEGRGVSPATARQVAEELNASDSLGAQLDIDGFDERTTIGGAVSTAVRAALAFLLGASVPILISVATPGVWRDEYTVVAVAAALAVTSVVLARLGHTRIWQTLLRSVFIGLAALGSSYLVGAALL
ncbi:MAG: VIT1/CCC1 transporter family protein [Propionicimonas sp.]|uniref:VIT1/CCC1 transporter family protein n=1 Tax=Propionicimonas sp. TaxID=1955623 RepID=UPI003D140AA0